MGLKEQGCKKNFSSFLFRILSFLRYIKVNSESGT